MSRITENIIAGGAVVLIASITPCIMFGVFLLDLGQRLDIQREYQEAVMDANNLTKDLHNKQQKQIQEQDNWIEILRTQVNQCEPILNRK